MTDSDDLARIIKSNNDPRLVNDLFQLWPELANELFKLEPSKPVDPVVKEPPTLSLRKPVARLTQISQSWSSNHDGIDYKSKRGDNIYAAANGVVVESGPAQGYGQWIIIDHEQNGIKFQTLYGHMYQRNLIKGQVVTEGQLIAYVGNEGQSTGPHLHFGLYVPKWELYKGVDPIRYLKS